MQQFKLSGKQYTIPSELEEVNYEMFIRFIKCETDLAKLQVLTGEKLTNIEGTKKVEQQMANVITLVDMLENDIQYWLHKKSNSDDIIAITILGKKLQFDKDLGKLPYWGLTKVKSIVKQMGKEPFNEYEHYTSLVANYVYSKFETYDEYKAEEFGGDVIKLLPFQHVIKLGDFFLYMQHRYWMPKTNYYSLKFQRMKKTLVSMFSLSTAR